MYETFLSDDDLRQLGRLTAVWSQIDYLLLGVISKLVRSDLGDVEILLEGAMIGSRISTLKKLSGRFVEGEVKNAAGVFCSRAHKLADKRNHLAHGIWGLYAVRADEDASPACYFPRNKKGLVFAHELPSIVDRSAELAEMLALVFDAVNGISTMKFDAPNEVVKAFHFGYGNPEGSRAAPPGAIYFDLLSLGHARVND
ncbi:hypothetical protein [Sinorhizobium meliloti]|uniref:hypothetical protein n=1 Tax=Rhizobium meliloti TaxID=382 RepID=UPI000D1E6823|nr:hypothetical protein [Sinorhizobium meliloti]RMI21383.1 hypothetical protein DA102_002195 [Sinorhizobium meliloti]